jgi:transcriptional regulator with XRE-family HTH domain
MVGSSARVEQAGSTASSTARRIVLGARLRRLREEAEVTRADAGYLIRASESKISRMELGRVGFKERDVADLLTMYGLADDDVREYLLQMAREANEPGWWNRYTDLVPSWFHDYVGLEESASRIQAYETQFVPGLLQTEAYARAIVAGGSQELSGDSVERSVALRMRRQKVLRGPSAPKLWTVIDEAVLHRPVGGDDVLREQVDHLLECTAQPNITVQVLPYRAASVAEGAFAMLRFAEPELPDVVYLEHLTGALYLDKRDEIDRYGRVFDRLTVGAETPDESRAWLSKLRTTL